MEQALVTWKNPKYNIKKIIKEKRKNKHETPEPRTAFPESQLNRDL